MKEHRLAGFVLSFALVAAFALTAANSAQAAPTISAVFFANVDSPVDIANAGDSRIFVVDQDGEIQVFDSAGVSLGTFLDIQNLVRSDDDVSPGFEGERGLLGLAFHPEYETGASNGFFYVNYTRDPNPLIAGEPGEGDTQVSRFTRLGAAGSNVGDPASEFPIITIPQPFSNHNAGDLNFGPDGNLWIAMGDGGAGCDPGDVSQDPLELLGKTLRIDVDGGSPYAIPVDNPFVGPDGIDDEIWSLGLRNPFRFSFDRTTGDLWTSDVGQNSWEEINFAPATSLGGENYGWDCLEGTHDASLPNPVGSSCSTTAACTGPFVDPVHEYDHSGGRCSVIGGYVYRGATYASLLNGYYFFADICSADLHALSPGACPGTFILRSYGTPVSSPSTFGESNTGELLVASLGGTIYRITASGTPDVVSPCATCSPTPLGSCRQPAPAKGKLLIKNDPSDDTKDKIIWKWLKGDMTPKTAFGDPDVFDSNLCIYVGTAQNLVVDTSIAGSLACPTCWSETTPGFKYKVPGGGIEKILMKSGDPGKAKLIVKGKGGSLPSLPSVPVTLPLLVQFTNSDGECWEANYSVETKNENNVFKAKSD